MSGDTHDRELAARLRAAAGAAPRPPGFDLLWRTAVARAAPPGGAAAPGGAARAPLRWLAPLAAAAALGVVVLLALLRGGAPRPGADAALERDLQLARALSPERQWHVPSDALLAASGYRTPPIIDLPEIHNPFEESVL